jgi:phthalate 4,5-cis-dihydrodiol dehydrogenase
MIRVGIIGAGDFGEQHAEAIAEQSNAKLFAASRTNKMALEAFTNRYGGRGYADYHHLLADPEVDAVVIATPHHLHTEIVIKAAQAGKHIMVEKPMALSLAECDRMVAATKKAGEKFMVGHNNHFVPAYLTTKDILDSGELGEVVLGVSTMSKRWINPNRREWHLDRRYGGGMWLTVGVHAVDRLTWLMDSPVESVSAHLDTRFHDQHADDLGMVFLRYKNGVVGTVVSAGFETGVMNFSTELTCTKGMLKVVDDRHVFIGRDEQWQQISGTEGSDWMMASLVNEWRAFLSAIENDTTPLVTGEFARHIMAVVFAAEDSSRLKKEIKI